MAIATCQARCVKCEKERSTIKCAGCSQDFCYRHWPEHHQELSKQLDEIDNKRNLLQQIIIEQKTDPEKHSLIKQINKWEQDSIKKIQQTANECRKAIGQYTTRDITHITDIAHTTKIEVTLSDLTNKLKQVRNEDDFNEINLLQFTQKLTQIEEEFRKPPNISIYDESSPFVSKISVGVSYGRFISSTNINIDTKWKQNGVTIAGGNGYGNQLNQLSYPEGIYVDDDDQSIYIAGFYNHHIVEWKWGAKNSQVVAGGNGQGNRLDQLNYPTDVIVDKKNDSLIISDYENRRVVLWPRRNGTNGRTIISNINCSRLAMDNNGDLYVSDWKNNEVRRWKIGDTNGTIVAGGNGKGDNLNQLNTPTYIFVDEDYSVYVTDTNNHRVMKWIRGAKEGIIVAGGKGQGNKLTQLSHPTGVIVDQMGNVYVADSDNHRVVRWLKGSREGSIIIGGNGCGQQPNQFNYHRGLSFDRRGNLYVADFNNHRIQKFDIDSN